jgi:hypothetical protein
LKAQSQAEALRLINEILSENRDLITYEYVDKLGPGVQVMLVPNDNPYLLPLPEMLGPTSPETTPTPIPGETSSSIGNLPEFENVSTATPTPTFTPTPIGTPAAP